MKPIELNILWWDDHESEMNKLGIRPDIRTCPTRLITFYSIDNISSYTENDVEYTAIKSGGDEYIYPCEYKVAKELIEKLLC